MLLSFVLLMIVFRSILVPLKAAPMNLGWLDRVLPHTDLEGSASEADDHCAVPELEPLAA